MSCILNSRIVKLVAPGAVEPASPLRRELLLGAAGFAVLSSAAFGSTDPTTGLKRWGTGNFRRFGFLVYEATLWAGGEDPVRPPLALRLTYKRNIAGKDIAEASVKEMRGLGVADEAQLQRWGERMAQIFPDVRPEDRILGVHTAEGASFLYNDRLIGRVDDPAFARAFFAIWLDPKTSAPELRAALLRRV
nr:chalcone isomerase family protein [Dechloromonas sp.]